MKRHKKIPYVSKAYSTQSSPSHDFRSTLGSYDEEMHKIEILKNLEIQKALSSTNINKIYDAQKYLKSIESKDTNQGKSMLIDPFDLGSGNGYKEKNYHLSYDILRRMSKTHVINSIIKTRKNQISNFAEPQADQYSTGFIIQKKQLRRRVGKADKLTAVEEKKIDYITEFILNCGTRNNIWHAHTFETFLRLIVDDSLTLDQATFEIPRDKTGQPVEFYATDGATFRIADNSRMSEREKAESAVNGYLPSYVQVYQGQVLAEFYPWELCFGVRNNTTSILQNGYGSSELEDLIKTVTSLLNADQYNANFFKVGSNPRGLISYTGNINPNTLSEFRENWTTQMTGVGNAHKVPIINADKVSWINTHETNREMEYSKYQEFLIQICSAVYTIDPSEFGFNISSPNSSAMFEGSNEYKLKYSKDKGLKPLLRQIQFWLNKFVVSQIDPDYELIFVGLDEATEMTELDNDIKELNNFATLNEIRAKRNLDPIPNGEIPMNQSLISWTAQKQQAQQAAQQDQGQDPGQDPGQDQTQQDPGQAQSPSLGDELTVQKSMNPFVTNFNNYLSAL